MRLYQQLVLFMLAATVLPLAVVGFWLLNRSEAELVRRIQSEQRVEVEAVAESSAAQLDTAMAAVKTTAGLFPWADLTPAHEAGALKLLYEQSELVAGVVIVGGSGEPSAPFPSDGSQASNRHPDFEAAGAARRLSGAMHLDQISQHAPMMKVVRSGVYAAAGGGAAYAIALKVEDGDAPRFVLAELGLGNVEVSLRARATGGSQIDLVDPVGTSGLVVASSAPGRALSPVDPRLWAAAGPLVKDEGAVSFTVTLDKHQLAAVAAVPREVGLVAVAAVAEDQALAPVRAMRRTVLGAIGGALGLLLFVGFAFTRRLNVRLRRVTEGAEAFSRGELSRRIPVEGADELAELSGTFNRMGAELEGARARLQKWNDNLKQAVDEATAELRAAQEKLLEAQKLAAVGQLGAGVAHEINNPLCGILGNAQLMMLDRAEGDPDFETLRHIEQSAKRCKDITQNLLRFSQSQGPASLRPTDLNAVVREACEASQKQASGDGVTQTVTLEPGPLMTSGDPAQLSQVVGALLANARTAMAKTAQKELSVSTRRDGEELVLEVRDTGKGIKPEHVKRIFEPFFTTKDVWSNIGLGLSIAYRVLTEHRGRIDVATEVGKGSTFTVRLAKPSADAKPAAAKGTEPRSAGGQGLGITG